MKRYMRLVVANILSIIFVIICLASCHEVKEWENSPKGNFDAL